MACSRRRTRRAAADAKSFGSSWGRSSGKEERDGEPRAATGDHIHMSYIDVLIPGIIGLLLVTSPRLFTKTQGEMFEKTKRNLKTIGFVLIGVALLYLILRLLKA
jgi:uncharacterized protein YjeT (DUF2065 family)